MHLALPLDGTGQEVRAVADSAPPDRQPPPPPLRILLAEDELISQLALKVMLTRMGHSVTAVSNGRAAVQALREADFDCVFMDIQMPEMNGIEATRIIRDEAAFGPKARVPIIALTAYAMATDREKFLEAGMTAHVSKPVQREEIVRALARVLPAS